MTAYNGHRSWAAWNVALWIGNDEGLYRLALEALEECRVSDRTGQVRTAENRRRFAARRVLEAIGGDGAKTPDGARYSLTSIREALAGLES